MKTNQFPIIYAAFAALILFITSCNAPAKETATKATDTPGLTSGQKQATEKEIADLVKAFFQDVENLDIEKCMTYFENTTDFQAVNPDGTFGNFDALKKLNADGFSQLATYKVTPKKEAIRVLSDSLVLYTFLVGQAGILKTGEKVSYDNVAGTMLFAKINDEWKATFYHESAAAPVVRK
ncbi:nuclear transport factor 2 family protein [Dyadobacter arcticus]|uniref:Ketosteroid isomerase-like protein n=1 Tax=Dyadobacter arcticus TaxID=1078754 RepID=A0ABX0UML2_9BACT|nr:nuclear transport factor 2 family protein [Dyadobacter arcticus]NIJ52685.1 ketosteroid isomerase-like protein [Dyadobacter arcticus]